MINAAHIHAEDRSLYSSYSGEIQTEIELAIQDVTESLTANGYRDLAFELGERNICQFNIFGTGMLPAGSYAIELEESVLRWLFSTVEERELPDSFVAEAEAEGTPYNITAKLTRGRLKLILIESEEIEVSGVSVMLAQIGVPGTDAPVSRLATFRALHLIYRGLMRSPDDHFSAKAKAYDLDYTRKLKEIVKGGGAPGIMAESGNSLANVAPAGGKTLIRG
jgi:hypothetical protein